MNKDIQSKKIRDSLYTVLYKAALPGVLITWAGFIGNWYLTKLSDSQESARLITELQLCREQAESELRKDVFAQTLQAFLLRDKDKKTGNAIEEISKQMLRLELLSLNFGDSLSLSPLFKEFRRDLKNIEPTTKSERPTFQFELGELRRRLNSLARRVASTQLTSLEQHGITKTIRIPFFEYSDEIVLPCKTLLFTNKDFSWPAQQKQREYGIYDESYKLAINTEYNLSDIFDTDTPIKTSPAFKWIRQKLPFLGNRKEDMNPLESYRDDLNTERLMELEGVRRYLDVTVSNVDHCAKSAKITIVIYKEDKSKIKERLDFPTDLDLNRLSLIGNEGLEIEVTRTFELDYFNFPIVDNTRLDNNQRFAIILNKFDLKSDDPHMELTGMIFPSEYASLRDRSGMAEARQLLESALNRGKDKWDIPLIDWVF